jgi:hypothetical protein
MKRILRLIWRLPRACAPHDSDGAALALPLAGQRAERPALNITGYVIDAELDRPRTICGQGGGQLYRAGNLDWSALAFIRRSR